jgi:hypothetical protein
MLIKNLSLVNKDERKKYLRDFEGELKKQLTWTDFLLRHLERVKLTAGEQKLLEIQKGVDAQTGQKEWLEGQLMTIVDDIKDLEEDSKNKKTK